VGGFGKNKMNMLSGRATKTFTLLSIGQRGVGKTVFLAGSYAELHSGSETESPQQLWFDCQDTQVQETIENILSYVVTTGEYPPPTLKITNFNFSLKRHSIRGVQTLCHFRWWDIPGEICDIKNPDFKTMVANSHGGCVFIDAYKLVHNNAYLQVLKDIIDQVMSIASLVQLNELKYPFALILTKCDLLEPGSIKQKQVEEELKPLTNRLDGVKANYQQFYSFIPIVYTEGASTLKPASAAAPLLWLVWELNKAHNLGGMKNPLLVVTPFKSSRSQVQQLVDGELQSLFKPADKAVRVKKTLNPYLSPTAGRNLLLLALAIIGLVGITTSLFVDYKRFLQTESKNVVNAQENIATLLRGGNFNQALPLMEKLVQQEPERLELRLQLAALYEFTGQVNKAETAYDQVLAQQKNNLEALVGKAVLRHAQGDNKTAIALFAQAEKIAPSELKAQVRAAAQRTFQPPAKLMHSSK